MVSKPSSYFYRYCHSQFTISETDAAFCSSDLPSRGSPCLYLVAMAFHLLLASAATTLLVIVSILIMRHLRTSQILQAAKKDDYLDLTSGLPEPTMLSKSLALALPDSVIFPNDAVAFKRLMNSYWAQQECEVIPACVVQPRDVQRLCTAVAIIKHYYDEGGGQAGEERGNGLFAIRSGGHSPVSGAASIKGGVLIDLARFREVIPSEDGSSVTIGAGAKWMDVSKVLGEKGLAVVGGRNSAVGVGGLTLGGELRLFTSTLAASIPRQIPKPSPATPSFHYSKADRGPNRRPFLLLLPLWLSLLQYHQLRNCSRLRLRHLSFRVNQSRSLARP